MGIIVKLFKLLVRFIVLLVFIMVKYVMMIKKVFNCGNIFLKNGISKDVLVFSEVLL